MENINDLQIRAFYERLKALSNGGIVVNGLMVLSQARFEDLLETYRTYFFDAISDFDDESYHESLSYAGDFDSLKEKLDDIENNIDSLESLASKVNKDEPVENTESNDDVLNLGDSDSEGEPEEETETVESEVDPVVANAFGVKKDADDDVNSYSDSVDEKISDSLGDSMNFGLEAQSESQLAKTYNKETVNSLKSENDSFSAGKSFNKRFDAVASQLKSDNDQSVKSSAEVLASEVINSESSLESLDDSVFDNVGIDDSDTFTSDDIHVTANNTESDDELDLDSDLKVDGLLDQLPFSDSEASDEN